MAPEKDPAGQGQHWRCGSVEASIMFERRYVPAGQVAHAVEANWLATVNAGQASQTSAEAPTPNMPFSAYVLQHRGSLLAGFSFADLRRCRRY